MKKLIIMSFLVLLLCTAIFAQEEMQSSASPLRIEGGGGLTIEIPDVAENEEVSLLDGISMLFNMLRVGVFANVRYEIVKNVTVGAELGLFAFTTSDEDGNTQMTPLIDIPIRAVIRYDLGVLGVMLFGGYNFANTMDLSTASGLNQLHKLEAGARIYLGGLYVDGALLFWQNNSVRKSSKRIGLGFAIPIM